LLLWGIILAWCCVKLIELGAQDKANSSQKSTGVAFSGNHICSLKIAILALEI
jgi:hypothetical protein